MSDFATLEKRLKNDFQILDELRAEKLRNLSSITNRNTIAYYSGFLTPHPARMGYEINDLDVNALMNVVYGMDRSKGLDLILHTPGGGIAATEQIVQYLRNLFNNNIRCIVPQIAMSAGTMIACAGKSILMGRQSCLGPIDPQLLGCPCHGVIEEFETAVQQIQDNPARIAVWRPIIEKYNPTFLGECQKAIDLSNQLVENWLATSMFVSMPDNEKMNTLIPKEMSPQERAHFVVGKLSNHQNTKTHDRHISAGEAQILGLYIEMLEEDQNLQDAVLSVHHVFMLTFMHSTLIKIVESDSGRRFMINGGKPG
ncbi:MAG: ATP-dependent Clp protease proteolytic subunit [Kiritimatiellae bacterium]|nr:ATP-dependent Clp protease proteolytic subunit [Kiritimatiellia bacterium]